MKIRDTKLGQWLKEKAPKVLDKVADFLPDKGFIGIVKNILDQDPDVTPEQKSEFAKLEHEFELELLKDMQDARAANVKIQESLNASWLAKNTAYILDFIFVVSFIVMLAMIFYRIVPSENKELFYMAFGLLGANVGNIINFHRGSSKGSEDKQRSLDRMINR
jgi:hypothetical protein